MSVDLQNKTEDKGPTSMVAENYPELNLLWYSKYNWTLGMGEPDIVFIFHGHNDVHLCSQL